MMDKQEIKETKRKEKERGEYRRKRERERKRFYFWKIVVPSSGTCFFSSMVLWHSRGGEHSSWLLFSGFVCFREHVCCESCGFFQRWGGFVDRLLGFWGCLILHHEFVLRDMYVLYKLLCGGFALEYLVNHELEFLFAQILEVGILELGAR